MAYRFPIARKLLALAGRARRNWLARHQLPFNYWIHMVGIPLALAGVALFFVTDWYWGLAAFVGGYFLQWVGSWACRWSRSRPEPKLARRLYLRRSRPTLRVKQPSPS